MKRHIEKQTLSMNSACLNHREGGEPGVAPPVPHLSVGGRLYLKPVQVGLNHHHRPIPVQSLREFRISHPITRRRNFTRGLPISSVHTDSFLAFLPYPWLLTRPPSRFQEWLGSKDFRGSPNIVRYLAFFSCLIKKKKD